MRVQHFQKVLWWPLMLRQGVAIALLKQMSTIQQTLNLRFLGVTLVFILLKRDQRRRETIKRWKLHYQQVQTEWVQCMYCIKSLIQSNLYFASSLSSGRCGNLIKLQQKKSHFSNIMEWKTPSDHWRGGSKWVGGRVVTVHMWNKCPG